MLSDFHLTIGTLTPTPTHIPTVAVAQYNMLAFIAFDPDPIECF